MVWIVISRINKFEVSDISKSECKTRNHACDGCFLVHSLVEDAEQQNREKTRSSQPKGKCDNLSYEPRRIDAKQAGNTYSYSSGNPSNKELLTFSNLRSKRLFK